MGHLLYFKSISSLLLILNVIVNPISGQTAGDDHTQGTLNPAQDLTYLRVIYNDSTEAYYRNHECPDGIWQENVKTNPTVSCVCVKGVYAVSSSLCDEFFQIITGNEHCYSLDRLKPRKFFPLLGKLGFKERTTTVFREDAPYFARLVSLSPNNYIQDKAKYVLRVNDPNMMSIYQNDGDTAWGLKCLPGQSLNGKSQTDLEKKPLIQIAELPNCANEFWGEQDWCSTAGNINYNYAIDIGKSWNQNTKSSKSGIEYNGKCNGAPSLDPAPDFIDNAKLVAKWTDCEIVQSDKNPQDGDDYKKPNPFQLDGKNMTKLHGSRIGWHADSQHQLEANEVTRKVAKALVARALDGKKLPGINLTEFDYLRQSKVIFLKVCPTEDIPIPAVNFLITAFRLLLLESEKVYTRVDISDQGLNESMMDTLAKCATRAKPIKYFENCTSKENFVEYTFPNDTLTNASLVYNNKTDQNLTLPDQLVFDTADLSFPIELVWKLMAHTHYYCAVDFRTGYEHSAFQAKIEAMLTTPPLLYQWRHPGASLQVYQLLMSRYDLVDLAEKIDRCVAHAREVSEYPEWINRPADFIASVPKNRKKRYHFTNNIWEGRAFCLSSAKEIHSQVTTYHEGLCAAEPIYYKNTD